MKFSRSSGEAFFGDNLIKPGFSLGWVSALDFEGRTIWIVDAHRDDGRRFIVRAEELLTAFAELEREVLTVTFYLRIDQCRLVIETYEHKGDFKDWQHKFCSRFRVTRSPSSPIPARCS